MQSPTSNNSRDRRDSFGARLRHERERRKISIASIADSTKILGALLEGLEKDDVSRWPIGFYRRAFLRSYATAIGLNPDEVWREFAERFPEPEPPAPPPTADTVSRRARLRLTLAQQVAWFVGGRVLERVPPRCAAVSFDLVVLMSVAICSFVVLGVFWAPLSVAAVAYYCGGVLILGNSPGVCLFAPSAGEKPQTQQPPTPQTKKSPMPQTPQAKQPPVAQMTPMARLELAENQST